MYKTALPLVCSGLFRRAAFFVGRIKKENKILVKYREKVYTFPSLKRDSAVKKSGGLGIMISRCPLARFVKGVLSCQKNVQFVEKARPPATM